MSGIKIANGTAASAEVTVDTDGNAHVTLPTDDAQTGKVRIMSENDAGVATGSVALLSPETSEDYRLRVGMDTLLFGDTFNAATQNTNNWTYVFATMTASQPGSGQLQFGTVQGTASPHGAFMRTAQYFPLVGTAPLSVEFTCGQFTSALIANEEWLCGLGLPSAAGTVPTDGAWYLLTSAGLIGVISYNSSVTQTGTLIPNSDMTLGELFKLAIVIGEGAVQFWRDDVLLGTLAIPAANGQPFLSATQPAFMQKRCTGAVSNTNTMRVSDVTITLMDIASNKPWGHQLCTAGQSSGVGLNGHTQGKTSLWTNNTAPTAAALTNTTAAFTGLGGIVAVLPTLAANSDGILINYTNPASSATIAGRNLIITGVQVNGVVTVVHAGGPVIYAMALAYGHTAVSLATPETGTFVTATTRAPRILPIGIGQLPVTAAVGAWMFPVGIDIGDAPVVVRPGEMVAIVLRNVGVVTTSGAVTMTAAIIGYWE